MIQLDIGRSNDGLTAIVSLRRHGNNGLRRVCWVALLRQRFPGAAGIERREIFRRRVVDHVIPVKGSLDRNLPRLRPELYQTQYRHGRGHVTDHR